MRTAIDEDRMSLDEPRRLASRRFGDLVTAVVGVEWGINVYPDLPESDRLEFDSMIKLRPSFGNRSRGVDDPAIREGITRLVVGLVRR